MPFMEVTYPQGALTDDARERLADELTTALLRAERAPDTEFFRSITWLYLHELPAGKAVRPVDERGEVRGARRRTPRRRADVPPRGPDAAGRALRPPAQGVRGRRDARRAGGGRHSRGQGLRIWVLCKEIAEGSWGAAGQVVEFEALRAAAAQEREKAQAEAQPAA